MSEEYSNNINRDLFIKAAYQKFKKLEKSGVVVKENVNEMIANYEKEQINLMSNSIINNKSSVNDINTPISDTTSTAVLVDNIKNKYLEYKKLKQYLYNVKLGMLGVFFVSSTMLIYYGPYKKRLSISLGKAVLLPLSVVLFTNYILQSSIKSKYKESLMEIINLKLTKI